MKSKTKSSAEILKIIGITSMVVDHVGLFLFPGLIQLRIIGRLALPIFASGIANGFKHTSNLKAYLGRLFLVGIIVQLPVAYFTDYDLLNIMFTFIWGLLFLYCYKKKWYFLSLLVLISTFIIEIDYGYYGILLIFIFYLFKKKSHILIFASLATLVFALHTWIYQIFLIFGVLLVLYFPYKSFSISLPRYFFYWFYPIHLIILLVIRAILDGSI